MAESQTLSQHRMTDRQICLFHQIIGWKIITKGATIQSPGGGGGLEFFKINNFGLTLCELNNIYISSL